MKLHFHVNKSNGIWIANARDWDDDFLYFTSCVNLEGLESFFKKNGYTWTNWTLKELEQAHKDYLDVHLLSDDLPLTINKI